MAAVGDTRLDDLLDEVEPARTSPRPRPSLPVRGVLLTLAMSAVAYTGFRAFGLAPPYPLIVAIAAAAVLIRTATKASTQRSGRRVRQLLRPPAAAAADDARPDGVFDAVRRWDRLLNQGSTTRSGGVAALTANLGELADERLRQRHGLTRASDPRRARSLLGEELWALLIGHTARPPTAAELTSAIHRLENL